ncbi:hypothetical protein EVAR_42415_1 [Eumeta japonica]|uniref:Uncharacterized protein n=1 Tax=Eumeta variegata TaxID=151549 RepID=A0A4C1X8Z2_EUMVA|nr:hypothetical protein EVAR_42415_1 [Eumeta japonica]
MCVYVCEGVIVCLKLGLRIRSIKCDSDLLTTAESTNELLTRTSANRRYPSQSALPVANAFIASVTTDLNILRFPLGQRERLKIQASRSEIKRLWEGYGLIVELNKA